MSGAQRSAGPHWWIGRPMQARAARGGAHPTPPTRPPRARSPAPCLPALPPAAPQPPHLDVQRVLVRHGVHRNRLQPHFLARPDDAHRNLATVGYHHLLELSHGLHRGGAATPARSHPARAGQQPGPEGRAAAAAQAPAGSLLHGLGLWRGAMGGLGLPSCQHFTPRVAMQAVQAVVH